MVKMTIQIIEGDDEKIKVNLNVPKKTNENSTDGEKKAGAVIYGKIDEILKDLSNL